MKTKRLVFMIIKVCIDAVMTVLFLLLMGYHLLDGKVHEWLGISLFIAFIIHNGLNYKWYLVLFKGKYNAIRIIQTVIDFLLWIAMICCALSAVSISAHIFDGLNITWVSFGRKLHLSATVWTFLLMSLHLGLHWDMFIGMAKKNVPVPDKVSIILKWVFRAIVIAVCIYGAYHFYIRKLWEELFLLTEFKWFDYEKTVALYLAESCAIMILFASVSYYAKKLILLIKKKHRKTEALK